MTRIYLDWNATAPLWPEVRDARTRARHDAPGNASSGHRAGRAARALAERARRALARAVGAPPQAVVLCGGATEANNQVLTTHARYTPNAHIACSAVEHPSVIEVVQALSAQGTRVTILPVDAQGRLDLDALARALEDGVTLVSVMWANNEIGNIYPVEAIAALAHARGALLHVDATQALGRVPIDLSTSQIDLLTLSLHKAGGPKGVGATILREGLVLEAMLAGGHQERGRRPGTENVPALAGAEALAALVHARAHTWRELLEHKRGLFLDALTRADLGFTLRGDPDQRLPNTLNLAFEHVSGEDLLLRLDLAGVAMSSGSACTAGSLEPSHVLLAMGYAPDEALRSVRVSFGPMTDDDALLEAAARLTSAARALRSS